MTLKPCLQRAGVPVTLQAPDALRDDAKISEREWSEQRRPTSAVFLFKKRDFLKKDIFLTKEIFTKKKIFLKKNPFFLKNLFS